MVEACAGGRGHERTCGELAPRSGTEPDEHLESVARGRQPRRACAATCIPPTRLLQAVLVAAALALLGLATASARGLDPAKPTFLPEGSGVLVMDLSLSIGEKDYADIRRTSAG